MTQLRTDWQTLRESAREIRAERLGTLTGTTVLQDLLQLNQADTGGGGGTGVGPGFSVFTASGSDDTAAFQAALNALPYGGVIRVTGRVQISSADITVPAHVSIVTWAEPGLPDHSNFSTAAPAIILANNHKFILAKGTLVEGLYFLRAGLTTVTTVQQGYIEKAASENAGTAIQISVTGGSVSASGDDTYLRNLFIVGFQTGVLGLNTARVLIDNVKCDCTNGLNINNSGDVLRVFNCQNKGYRFAPLGNGDTTLSGSTGTDRCYFIQQVNNNGGLIEIQTDIPHPFVNGNTVLISGVQDDPSSTTANNSQTINGRWPITVTGATRFTLNGSTWLGPYSVLTFLNAAGTKTFHAVAFASLQNAGRSYAFTNCDSGQAYSCFTHGWDEGYYISSTTCKFVQCGVEGGGSGQIKDPIPIGVHVQDDGNNVPTNFVWMNGDIADVGTTILFVPLIDNNTGAPLASKIQGTFIGNRLNYGQTNIYRDPTNRVPANANYTVNCLSGIVQFIGTTFSGGSVTDVAATHGVINIGAGCEGAIFDQNPNFAVVGNAAFYSVNMNLPLTQFVTNAAAGPAVVARQNDMLGGNYCYVSYNNIGTGTLTTRNGTQLWGDFNLLQQIAFTGFAYVLQIGNTGTGPITLTPPDASVTITGGAVIAPRTYNNYLVQFTAQNVVNFQFLGLGQITQVPLSQLVTNSTAGPGTVTAAVGDLTGAQECVLYLSAVGTAIYRTRTATQMFGDIPAAFTGMTWFVTIVNTDTTGTITLAPGAGVTVGSPGTYTIASGAARRFLFTFTAAPPSAAVTVQSLDANLPPSQIVTNSSSGSTTAVAGDMTGAQECVLLLPSLGTGNYQTRQAANLFGDMPGAAVGTSWFVTIANTNGSGTVTLTAGSGVTLVTPGSYTIAAGTQRRFLCTFTGAAALNIQSLGGATL